MFGNNEGDGAAAGTGKRNRAKKGVRRFQSPHGSDCRSRQTGRISAPRSHHLTPHIDLSYNIHFFLSMEANAYIEIQLNNLN